MTPVAGEPCVAPTSAIAVRDLAEAGFECANETWVDIEEQEAAEQAARLDELQDACRDGDQQACDDLWIESPTDSEYEAFAEEHRVCEPEYGDFVNEVLLETTFTPERNNGLAEAIEDDFFWVESVDRLKFDPDAAELRIDATVAFAGVYERDRSEWLSDTWELYVILARDLWGAFTEAWDDSDELTCRSDWAAWTPRFILSGNGGALSISCPGSMIYGISQRDATQTDYASECQIVN